MNLRLPTGSALREVIRHIAERAEDDDALQLAGLIVSHTFKAAAPGIPPAIACAFFSAPLSVPVTSFAPDESRLRFRSKVWTT